MADEEHVVRTVSWNEIFSFPHVFKSFKMAIHPSKILLALAAIIATVVLGFVMDWVWAGVSDSNRIVPNEVWKRWTASSRTEFLAGRKNWLKEDRVKSLRGMLVSLEVEKDTGKAEKLAQTNFGSAVGDVKEALEKRFEKALADADKAWDGKTKEIGDDANLDKDEKAKARDSARAKRRSDKQAALAIYTEDKQRLERAVGGKIFSSFLNWQLYCLRNAVSSVYRGNITTGLGDLYGRRGSMTLARLGGIEQVAERLGGGELTAGEGDMDPPGLVSWLVLMLWGLWWIFSTYPFYSIIYLLAALAIWSVCGGAVCRIAALHAAREEKISMAAAVKFSLSKFLSFFAAPLLPLVFIVVTGLCLALGGLAGAIPYVGEFFVAILFLIALLAGVFMAFLTVGLVAGGPLMWPTIAVEGSDTFDAISRSFTYVFKRPFRYILYLLAAAVHGTVCYLFVRLFAFLTLSATHTWAGWAMKLSGQEHYANGAGKLDVMWPAPTFSCFRSPLRTEGILRGSESVAAYLLSVWVYLVAGVVLAFLVCYAFSATTNIYLLLRRKEDTTDLDDVYVEETEEAEEKAAEAETVAPEAAPPQGQTAEEDLSESEEE